MAEPRLFRSLSLLPYTDYLGDLASVMQNNSSLACHVKSVSYDIEWQYTPGLQPDPDTELPSPSSKK